jgi:hypothetical protein
LAADERHSEIVKNLKEIRVIFEAFTVVTVKNAVFWDIKTQFVLHRKHYFSAT